MKLGEDKMKIKEERVKCTLFETSLVSNSLIA